MADIFEIYSKVQSLFNLVSGENFKDFFQTSYLHENRRTADAKKANLDSFRAFLDSLKLQDSDTKKLLKYHATACLSIKNAIDLGRLSDGNMLPSVSELNIRLESFYGSSLSKLGRYFEADRHLNRALATLTKTGRALQHGGTELIRLRRAARYLDELERMASQNDELSFGKLLTEQTFLDQKRLLFNEVYEKEVRKFVALLDDAFMQCEFAGKRPEFSVSAYQWAFFESLTKLKVYRYSSFLYSPSMLRRPTGNPEIAIYEPLAFRRRGRLVDYIQNAFHDSLNRSKQDLLMTSQAIYEYIVTVISWRFVGEDVSSGAKDQRLLEFLADSANDQIFVGDSDCLLRKTFEDLKGISNALFGLE